MVRYAVGVKLGTLGNPNHPFALNVRKAMEDGSGSLAVTLISKL